MVPLSRPSWGEIRKYNDCEKILVGLAEANEDFLMDSDVQAAIKIFINNTMILLKTRAVSHGIVVKTHLAG